MNPTPAALFFDLDGTLADTERLHWQSWREAVASFGVDLDWETYQRKGVGVPDRLLADILRNHFNSQLDAIEAEELLTAKKRSFEAALNSQVLLPTPNISLLRRLSDYPKALVTMSSRAEAHAILAAANVLDAFQVLIFFEDVRRPKPDPEPYQLAMKRLGVQAGLAFEDSSRGLASARAAGLEVVPVRNPSELAELAGARLNLR